MSPAAAPTHACRANRCTVQVDHSMLMCIRHWRQVPKPMQARVWATFRRFEVCEVRARRGNPMAGSDAIRLAYFEAVADAVEAVARDEGCHEDNDFRARARSLRGAMATVVLLACLLLAGCHGVHQQQGATTKPPVDRWDYVPGQPFYGERPIGKG